MKYYTIAALMAASATAMPLMDKPITDNFLWINEESGLTKVGVKGETMPFDATALQLDAKTNGKAALKDLSIVPIKFHNGYKGNSAFIDRHWDLLQDCLNNNSDEDQWTTDGPSGYKEVPLAHSYDAGLVQL